MTDEEVVGRLLSLLGEACHRSRRSRRDLERAMGVANGYLSHLLAGRVDLKVRHIAKLTSELGIDTAQFFRDAFPDPNAQPAPAAEAPAPPAPASAAAPEGRDLLRGILREMMRTELLALLAENVHPAPSAGGEASTKK